MQLVPQGGAPIVNRGGLASGALLRDIHNGLLRIVEGKASNTEPPAMAKVVVSAPFNLQNYSCR